MNYDEFLLKKVALAKDSGFEIEKNKNCSALPPEQWDGVKVLMRIIKQMQDMGAENPVIDLPSLRAAWQSKMNGVVN